MTFDNAQPSILTSRTGRTIILFNGEHAEGTEPDGEGMGGTQEQWSYDSITLEGKADYDGIVSALVTDRYSMDAQIALLANRGDGNAEHQSEYEAFEAYRDECKAMAKAALGL